MRASVVAAIALLAVNLILVVVLVVARWSQACERRHHGELVHRLRRPAVELIDAEEPTTFPSLGRDEKEVFAELLSGYSRGLRGTAKDRIANYFESSGAVKEEVARLGSRRSHRRAAAAFALGDMGSQVAMPDLL